MTMMVVAFGMQGTESAWGLSWTQPTTPVTKTEVASISCPTTTCMSVGSYSANDGPTFAFAAPSSTPPVLPKATPNPAGALASELNGVSCATSTDCVAVGTYTSSGGSALPLAVSWNGTSWSLQTAPTPAGATAAHLNSVSCTSSSACTAAGDATVSGVQRTMVMRWNGLTWTLQTTPNPSGSTAAQLNGVACASSTICTAVGSYTNGSGSKLPTAMGWNGTTWTLHTVPSATGSGQSLNGISCSSTTECIAVGDSTAGGFARRWTSGTTWTSQTVPSSTHLKSVSCPSSTFCNAVGDYSGDVRVLIWNGTTWSAQTTLLVYGTAGLDAVSCDASTSCLVAGHQYQSSYPTPEAIEYHWNGTTWASAFFIGAFTQIQAVSCWQVNSCMTVGIYNDLPNGHLAPIVRSWNGSAWSSTGPPNSATSAASLASVSCPTSTSCMAVGTSDSGLLAEQWNGSTWTQRTVPSPGSATNSYLRKISCRSASMCVAVGDWRDASGNYFALLETWNGSTWTIQSITNPPGSSQLHLYGVSCSGTTACTAVGWYDITGGTAPLAIRWDGTSATTQSPPQQSNTQDTMFRAVSCPATNVCLALGTQDYNDGKAWQRWNGTSWTPLATPNIYALADDVYCTTAEVCRVVGSSSDVLEWNGSTSTWTNQSSMVDPITRGNLFPQGLSCVSLSWCMVVGNEYAELWS